MSSALHAARPPIGVKRLATPPPAIPPMMPPRPGRRISTIAKSAGSAAMARSARRASRADFSPLRSYQTPNAISAGGSIQRPAPNHGARTSRSASARSPRPGRISPTASTTPVTANAKKTSVRAAAPLITLPPLVRVRRPFRATLDLDDDRHHEWSSPRLSAQESRNCFAKLRLDQPRLRTAITLMLDRLQRDADRCLNQLVVLITV